MSGASASASIVTGSKAGDSVGNGDSVDGDSLRSGSSANGSSLLHDVATSAAQPINTANQRLVLRDVVTYPIVGSGEGAIAARRAAALQRVAAR